MQGEDAQACFFEGLSNVVEMLDALQQLPDALFMIKDRDSRYVYMSRGLRQSIHLPDAEEIVGKTDYDLFPPIVADRFRQNDLLVLRDGKTLLDEIHAAMFFDAPAAWYFSSKWPLRNRDGRIIGLIATNRRYADVMGDNDQLSNLLPAIDIISKGFADKITIDNLARACGLSSSHFMRLFRERLGVTAYQFLEQVRLQRAITALKHSSLSVSAVAQQCGFYDHSSFIKKFKRLTGTTPFRFRRDHQEKFASREASALPDWSNLLGNDDRRGP